MSLADILDPNKRERQNPQALPDLPPNVSPLAALVAGFKNTIDPRVGINERNVAAGNPAPFPETERYQPTVPQAVPQTTPPISPGTGPVPRATVQPNPGLDQLIMGAAMDSGKTLQQADQTPFPLRGALAGTSDYSPPLAVEPIDPRSVPAPEEDPTPIVTAAAEQAIASTSDGTPEARQGFFDKVMGNKDLLMAGLIVLAGAMRRPELGQNASTLFADGLQQGVMFYQQSQQTKAEQEQKAREAALDREALAERAAKTPEELALLKAQTEKAQADAEDTKSGRSANSRGMNPTEYKTYIARLQVKPNKTAAEKQEVRNYENQLLQGTIQSTVTNFPEEVGATTEAARGAFGMDAPVQEATPSPVDRSLTPNLERIGAVTRIQANGRETFQHNFGNDMDATLDLMLIDAEKDGDYSEYIEALTEIEKQLAQRQ